MTELCHKNIRDAFIFKIMSSNRTSTQRHLTIDTIKGKET